MNSIYTLSIVNSVPKNSKLIFSEPNFRYNPEFDRLDRIDENPSELYCKLTSLSQKSLYLKLPIHNATDITIVRVDIPLKAISEFQEKAETLVEINNFLKNIAPETSFSMIDANLSSNLGCDLFQGYLEEKKSEIEDSNIARDIDTYLEQHNLDPTIFREYLFFGGWIHDIGKIFLNSALLDSPINFYKPESIHMKDTFNQYTQSHPITGYKLLLEMPCMIANERPAYYHHRGYNGEGYPNISHDQIQLRDHLISAIDKCNAILDSTRGYNIVDDRVKRLENLLKGGEANSSRGIFSKSMHPLVHSFLLDHFDEYIELYKIYAKNNKF